MISEAEALDRILAALQPLPAERLAIESAAGRYAAEDVSSSAPLPRFDQSAMDGYAIRACDAPGSFRMTGEQPAGAARGLQVGNREAVRIFTGAPIPKGADAVVMQEDVFADGLEIRIEEIIESGECIRRAGGDVCAGQRLVAKGELLTAPRIGLLSAAGAADLLAHRRPRVAIIATGDELRPAGSELAPGELYESNSRMLSAQLTPTAELAGTVHTPDDPAALARAIRSFPSADVVVISAGVSVGDHDPAHEALRQLNATVDFWQVAVKPGKPFLFASLGEQKIFGLPGNPVSTFVTAHLFVRPALLRMAGAADPRPFQFSVPLGAPVENKDGRPHYLRAALREGAAFPLPIQQSHALSGLARADVLIRLDSHASAKAGDLVAALPLIFH